MNPTDKYIQQVADFRLATNLAVNSGEGWNKKQHIAITLEELIEAADGMTDSIVTFAGIALDAPVKKSSQAVAVIERIHQAMIHIGFKPDACMDIVHAANMSKVCKADEVQPTKNHYNMIGVECYDKPTDDGLSSVHVAKDVTAKDGKYYEQGKLLKCINWHEPDWSDLSQWMESDLAELFTS